MTQKIINRVIQNFFNNLEDTELASSIRFPIRATIKLITENPELFSIDRVMSGPVDMYKNGNVVAKSRALDAKFSLEKFVDDRLMSPKHYENDAVETVVNELVSYIKQENNNGYEYIMYIPFIVMRSIDISTYQPYIGFKTRYDLVKKEI